eukprot:6430461-Amphidinium_carterae.1
MELEDWSRRRARARLEAAQLEELQLFLLLTISGRPVGTPLNCLISFLPRRKLQTSFSGELDLRSPFSLKCLGQTKQQLLESAPR